jgi:putative acetyltransferase
MASIIRKVMPEFGATGCGFAINDPEVDWMSRAYAQPRCAYFVVEDAGVVLGGGGIAPLEGGDVATCELRKMYFLPQARGHGAGAAMMERCLGGRARTRIQPVLPGDAQRHGCGDEAVRTLRLPPDRRADGRHRPRRLQHVLPARTVIQPGEERR